MEPSERPNIKRIKFIPSKDCTLYYSHSIAPTKYHAIPLAIKIFLSP